MNSLGRDRVWNDHTWSEIDKAVREEVGRARVAQKAFPSMVVNNVLPVVANRAVSAPKFGRATRGASEDPAAGDDQFQPFFEISREFVLTQAQVDGEENLHLAPSLARLAASAVASAEDAILFLGRHSILPLAGVNVTNEHAVPPGFVAEANNFEPVPISLPPASPDKNTGYSAPLSPLGEIVTAIAAGMAKLSTDGQPGPYALFLSPDRYAQTFAPTKPGERRAPGDQIKELVTGGFYMVNPLALASVKLANLVRARSEQLEKLHREEISAHREGDNERIKEISARINELENARSREALDALQKNGKLSVSTPETDIGILVSLGGEPAKIILGSEATTAFTHIDTQSKYHFRVFERIQMVVRDGRAFQTLEWPPQGGTNPKKNHS